ncbi:multicopper oxidase-domain-containing protein [Geopyxis carbonaria]|nr:multicopper oxidase-domain-containing protein [Geopyxis carbonaria]
MLLNGCLSYFTKVLNLLTLKVWDSPSAGSLQHPILKTPLAPSPAREDYPIFPPPNGPLIPGEGITCSYPTLTEYEPCSDRNDRKCWLRPKNPDSGLPTYNITTNYEDIFPEGVLRRYTLNASDLAIAPDGTQKPFAKVFDKTYPGPWITACWGDTIEIEVTNSLECNGTTVHWHGLRQWNSVEMDGVNAITQCPIAPGKTMTYRFKALQYGSTWYHSHYSLQYADGLAGPMTIFGPSSDDYDTAVDPILMTDWGHRSAFEDWSYSQHGGKYDGLDSILLNGIGKCFESLPRYNTTFQTGVRYLLRLINTSIDTTFIFSIDHHNVTMISSDFVPIHPYSNSSVLVGIGQRYHVIVEASPSNPTADGNYWIRTTPATGCNGLNKASGPVKELEKTGIVRYNPYSTALPNSDRNDFDEKCSDETYSSLKPILQWTVKNDALQTDDIVAQFRNVSTIEPKGPYTVPNPDKSLRWQLHKQPLWLDFSKPTVLNLDNTGAPELAVITHNTPVSAESAWIELAILGMPKKESDGHRGVAAAHPIHLHGHDFALLAQSEEPYTDELANKLIKRDNPPRRDVALLPKGGFLIIAFKADNPGTWLMHCHIAFHASSGLALQLLENVERMKINPDSQRMMADTCASWDHWMKNNRNESCSGGTEFQDDSGI